MKVIIPAFQPNAASVGWAYLSRYAHLGSSMGEIVRTLALHPLDALARSFEHYKLMTLLELFLPLGLLPLLGWRGLLVALPSLAYTFLSAHPNQFVLRYQYFSPALVWLVVAAVQGLRVWMSLLARFTARLGPGRWRTAVVLPLVVAVVATGVIDA